MSLNGADLRFRAPVEAILTDNQCSLAIQATERLQNRVIVGVDVVITRVELSLGNHIVIPEYSVFVPYGATITTRFRPGMEVKVSHDPERVENQLSVELIVAGYRLQTSGTPFEADREIAPEGESMGFWVLVGTQPEWGSELIEIPDQYVGEILSVRSVRGRQEVGNLKKVSHDENGVDFTWNDESFSLQFGSEKELRAGDRQISIKLVWRERDSIFLHAGGMGFRVPM